MSDKIKHKDKEFSQRQLRVSELIKRLLSEAFNQHNLFSDIIGDKRVTISEVRITADLKNATAFITSFDNKDIKSQIDLINDNSYRLSKYLSNNLSLKFIPKIMFKYDLSYDYAGHISDLINDIKS